MDLRELIAGCCAGTLVLVFFWWVLLPWVRKWLRPIRRCECCVFYRPLIDDARFGACVRRAPRAVDHTGLDKWPMVFHTNWCGKFALVRLRTLQEQVWAFRDEASDAMGERNAYKGLYEDAIRHREAMAGIASEHPHE